MFGFGSLFAHDQFRADDSDEMFGIESENHKTLFFKTFDSTMKFKKSSKNLY